MPLTRFEAALEMRALLPPEKYICTKELYILRACENNIQIIRTSQHAACRKMTVLDIVKLTNC